MTQGRFIAVVGPSGVGKDSVMAGIHKLMPKIHIVRRVITRAPGQTGEDYDPVTPAEFRDMANDGAFAMHWGAHGLRYGIPVTTRYQLNQGFDCLANVSRDALREAAHIFPNFVVLNISAEPETLANRLAERGRETAKEITQRLAVSNKPLPAELAVLQLSNDGPLTQTVARAVALLQPVRA